MPVAAIASGVGAVAGGISSGKGASKAAQIQADASAKQNALLQTIYNQNSALFQPDIAAGDTASIRQQQLLGLAPGGPSPTEILRSTPGYQFKLNTGNEAINSNAFAHGLGNSGATLKALLQYGQGVADQGFNNYYTQVGTIADRGGLAKSSLSGVSQNYAHDSNAVTQNGANAASSNAIFQAENIGNTIRGVLNAGGQAFGSSYGKGVNKQ